MEPPMILQQFYLNCLAHASYLIGDEKSGVAAVVDPQRDVEQYIEFARKHHLKIQHVFLSHFHADFLAGHLELRDREHATIYLGAKAKAEYEFTPLGDGDAVTLSEREGAAVRLQVMETPGHTPESICLLVFDRKADPSVASLPRDDSSPSAVLTGDTLFVGDVGRPDLRASLGWSADTLGRMLYHSVQKLLALPDDTLVYPAHGAGSLCGKAISKETVSTIGAQRQFNYALQPMSEDDFLRIVTADQPDAPAYFTYDAVLNSKERPTLDAALKRQLTPITLDELLEARDRGVQILDTRDPDEFANAHFKGSLNIGLGGEYATWAGTVLDRDKPIVIIADPGRETEAALRLGRIGFDIVLGYLAGGINALERRLDLMEGTDRELPAQVHLALRSKTPPVLLDVRAPSEYQAKHIKGSINMPLNRLSAQFGDVPRDRTTVVYCAGGYRSSIAASILQQHGLRDLIELSGGIAAWEGAKLPLEH